MREPAGGLVTRCLESRSAIFVALARPACITRKLSPHSTRGPGHCPATSCSTRSALPMRRRGRPIRRSRRGSGPRSATRARSSTWGRGPDRMSRPTVRSRRSSRRPSCGRSGRPARRRACPAWRAACRSPTSHSTPTLAAGLAWPVGAGAAGCSHLRSSRWAIVRLCTSSGPSARRIVRWWAYM